MQPKPEFDINTEQQLRDVIAEPPLAAADKVESSIVPSFADFIARSPLVMVATADRQHRLDVSPKGDAPGFVQVLNEKLLAIPERKGNRLAFGFQNILQTGTISLIFIIPGTRETLRLNGRARLNRDPHLLAHLAADAKPALLTTLVQVDEAFFHCGKALVRSQLWQASSHNKDGETLVRQYFSQRRQLDIQTVDQSLETDYSQGL
ncbi:pyridoxamine 5'-phosphate oxidase family protein [bacterium]|nr:pyridoxamine 5'-phosphate oxidase family protein [bacterium]